MRSCIPAIPLSLFRAATFSRWGLTSGEASTRSLATSSPSSSRRSTSCPLSSVSSTLEGVQGVAMVGRSDGHLM